MNSIGFTRADAIRIQKDVLKIELEVQQFKKQVAAQLLKTHVLFARITSQQAGQPHYFAENFA